MESSYFDQFGGYYRVLVDGVEISRWAPSSAWIEFASTMPDHMTYEWVKND